MEGHSYLAGFCTLGPACLLAAPGPSSRWGESPPAQVPLQSLCLCLSSFSSLPAVGVKWHLTVTDQNQKIWKHFLSWVMYLTSSPIVIVLVIVKGSTGPQALGAEGAAATTADTAAAAAAAASDSFCSRSLFFRFSSYIVEWKQSQPWQQLSNHSVKHSPANQPCGAFAPHRLRICPYPFPISFSSSFSSLCAVHARGPICHHSSWSHDPSQRALWSHFLPLWAQVLRVSPAPCLHSLQLKHHSDL